MMSDVLVPILVLALVVAIGVAVWLFMRQRRSEGLRERFGPEYDRAVAEHDDHHDAENELETRARRIDRLDIRPLAPDERDQFAERWRSAQAQFVDDPVGATREADSLVGEVMEARGYPVGDFEQRAADVSVNHPQVVENYRAAHTIALRNARGDAETEDLRKAMVHYRALFEDLLETQGQERMEVRQ